MLGILLDYSLNLEHYLVTKLMAEDLMMMVIPKVKCLENYWIQVADCNWNTTCHKLNF